MAEPPRTGTEIELDLSTPRVLIITFNRPDRLNAMSDPMEEDLTRVLDWFEEQESLWVVIVTGRGRAFCAGKDLSEWLNRVSDNKNDAAGRMVTNPHGFGSLARRKSKKIFIIALNGHTFGGGAEIAVHGDIVIAAEGIKLGFPEVKRGVVASVGGIPNSFWRSPMLLPYLYTGDPIPNTLLSQYLFNEVVPASQVLPTALEWAKRITTGACPEAVWATKDQITRVKAGQGMADLCNSSNQPDGLTGQLYQTDNFREGLAAFRDRREPRWQNPQKGFGRAQAKL